jgi:hypothetical protein
MKVFYLILLCFFFSPFYGQQSVEYQIIKNGDYDGIPFERIKPAIIDFKSVNNNCIITVSLIQNCILCWGGEYLIIQDEDTLNIFLNRSISYTESDLNGNKFFRNDTIENLSHCDLYFNANFTIKDLKKDISDYRIILNGIDLQILDDPFVLTDPEFKINELELPRYGIQKGDTINYIDKYGRKQGRHFYFNDKRKIPLSDIKYINNEVFECMYYDDKGVLDYIGRGTKSKDGARKWEIIEK